MHTTAGAFTDRNLGRLVPKDDHLLPEYPMGQRDLFLRQIRNIILAMGKRADTIIRKISPGPLSPSECSVEEEVIQELSQDLIRKISSKQRSLGVSARDTSRAGTGLYRMLCVKDGQEQSTQEAKPDISIYARRGDGRRHPAHDVDHLSSVEELKCVRHHRGPGMYVCIWLS